MTNSIKRNLLLKAEQPSFLGARVLGTSKMLQEEREVHHLLHLSPLRPSPPRNPLFLPDGSLFPKSDRASVIKDPPKETGHDG